MTSTAFGLTPGDDPERPARQVRDGLVAAPARFSDRTSEHPTENAPQDPA